MTKFHLYFIRHFSALVFRRGTFLVSAVFLLCGISLLNAQERDPRSRIYISPTRVVWQSDAGVQLADVLLKPGNGQAYCNNDTPESYCLMTSSEGVHPAILLDYGKELHGGLQLVTGPIGKPVQVRVRYGESASEAMSEIGGEGGATNDHSIRDQIITLPMMGVVEIGNSGFRFVRIDLVDNNNVSATNYN